MIKANALPLIFILVKIHMEDRPAYEDVLIADDDVDDFEVLRLAIHEVGEGVNVSRAENGEILLRLIEEHIPDLLFLDIHMPCRDGKSCIREIRSKNKFDHLPVIVYTGNQDSNLINFFYRYRANYFVYKPASYDELVDVVRKIFATRKETMLEFTAQHEFVMNS
jgi:response regulator RpfG family c-di-GMP phosphodiesterase